MITAERLCFELRLYAVFVNSTSLICGKSLRIEFEISKPLIILNIYNYCENSCCGCSPLRCKVLQKTFLMHFLELGENLRVSNVPKTFCTQKINRFWDQVCFGKMLLKIAVICKKIFFNCTFRIF